MALSERLSRQVLGRLPFLKHADPALQEAFLAAGIPVTLPPGTFICMEGNRCAHLPLVLSGTARVYKMSPEGREITLYRIEPGEACITTASCILSRRAFPAFAVAETEVEAVVIPTATFREWMGRYETWRTYVFELLATRLATVMEVVEEVAFHRMDTRLAAYLLEACTDVLARTHEAVAVDLGTSREVVSRLLKEFERAGWVSLARGAIRIVDADALRRHART